MVVTRAGRLREWSQRERQLYHFFSMYVTGNANKLFVVVGVVVVVW